eukprot:TRINITY_DN43717_c0_g1_i1.p1 TRINITY_DN43717_c0_g1~~TRINITY_DN43717_c0_g1_i1.p1  ORF type:complete len:314 (-),score=62.95 TRINITY_DN43717_c0_g1_i1:61-927(-)
MVADESVSFTLSTQGLEKNVTKTFELKVGDVVRVGRSPVANFMIEHRGISQYHADFRLLPDPSGRGLRLCVRDMSSNGTGLKKPDSDVAQVMKKDTDKAISNGCVLLVPMRLKEDHAGRAWLTVKINGQEESPKGGSEASGCSDEEKLSIGRKAFVQLLLKTRDIDAGTTYEQGRKLLHHESAWKACDEATRKECFHMFVDHLGEASTKKDKKKKGKDKEKEKGDKKSKDKAKDNEREKSRGDKKKDKDNAKERERKRPLSESPEASRRDSRKKKGGRRRDRSSSGSR